MQSHLCSIIAWLTYASKQPAQQDAVKRGVGKQEPQEPGHDTRIETDDSNEISKP